jgi:hypothetical protein
MNRFITIIAAVLTVCLLVAGCSSAPAAEPKPEPVELPSKVKTEVLDHKGASLGKTTLPEWIDVYIDFGARGVEELAKFQDEYCFIAEYHAENLDAGLAWIKGFEVPQLIARQIQSRVESLFVGAAVGAPEDDYGTYFENVVKTTTDVSFSGAKLIQDYWVLVRTYDPDIKNTYSDTYQIYVLYTMPKAMLDKQLNNEIDKAMDDGEMSESQKEAFKNVKKVLADSGL